MSAALPCAYGYSWRTLRYRPNWSSVTLSLQASSRSFWHLCPKHPFAPVTYWETMRGQGGVCTCLYKFLSMIKKKKSVSKKKKKKAVPDSIEQQRHMPKELGSQVPMPFIYLSKPCIMWWAISIHIKWYHFTLLQKTHLPGLHSGIPLPPLNLSGGKASHFWSFCIASDLAYRKLWNCCT